jgi:putative transposase
MDSACPEHGKEDPSRYVRNASRPGPTGTGRLLPFTSEKLLAEMATLATPDTILRWYRERVAAKYDGSRARRGPGRPRSHEAKVAELLRIARQNPSWGYTRLRGALENLGLGLGRSTIQRILREHGIEPAPLRGKTMPWGTFLRAHWGAIAAADFFSVEVLTVGGLVRYLIPFVIDLKTAG